MELRINRVRINRSRPVTLYWNDISIMEILFWKSVDVCPSFVAYVTVCKLVEMLGITSFWGHFTHIETLWKVVKWSMKWLYFCSRHTLFLWPYMVSSGALNEIFNVRWRWTIWKFPITAHPTLSSNVYIPAARVSFWMNASVPQEGIFC